MNQNCTGLDRRGQRLLLAATRQEGGRLVVERLESITPGDLKTAEINADSSLHLVVSDLYTMVKTVRMSDAGSPALRDRVQFELEQSLLEEPENFRFEHLSTGLADRHLGFIWRRDRLAELTASLGWSPEAPQPPLSFKARSIALGQGYLAVCDGRDDTLMVLVDAAEECASLCFLYNRNIVGVASMPLAGHDLSSDAGRQRFASDLRTLMNYRLSTLLDAGVTVPLSGLFLVGETIDASVIAAVQAAFPVPVAVPKPHEGFFGAIGDATRAELPLYLAALGLTVN